MTRDLTTTAQEIIRDDPALAAEVHRLMGERAVSGLTPVQLRLFDYISAYFKRSGIAPNFAEMTEHMGYASKSRVHRLLLDLEERGAIRRLPGRTRAISIVEAA